MKLSEALSWVKQQPDAAGECDGCHKEGKALWCLPREINPEPDAHWLYCRECFVRIARTKLGD